MMIPFIFAGAGLLGLFLILYLAKGLRSPGGNIDELASQLRPIDVDAFRNLIDEREEKFLRERLPTWEFRRIQRRRNLAAVEYIWCAAQNAAILIRLGEAARQNPDPAIAAAAIKTNDNPAYAYCRFRDAISVASRKQIAANIAAIHATITNGVLRGCGV